MDSSPQSDNSRTLRILHWGIIALIVLCFAARNLPWHLDDYDQAKQAYTSYEMVNQGHWMFQHTPIGKVATKPPLAGWISAGIYAVTHSWDIAWRLPGFIAGLVLLWIIRREGLRAFGLIGAILAMAFFGLNILSVRLATLVRTDMLLALCIFVVGWLIFRHLKKGTPWTAKERWGFFIAVLASMLVKGPIIFAFIAPGLLAFWLMTLKQKPRPTTFPGWTAWLVPLLVFGAWAAWGATHSEAFKEQVIFKEFLGRFGMTEADGEAIHKSQPIYYYLKVLGLTAPWSLLFLVFLATKPVRTWLKSRPDVLWLVCWAIGGFIAMSIVPSKRTDRIFPVILPAALALPYLAAAAAEVPGWWQRHWKILTIVFASISALGITGYTANEIIKAHRSNQNMLVDLGAQAQALTTSPDRLMVMKNKDEGVIIYAGKDHFVQTNDARRAWKRNEVDVLILKHSEWERNAHRYPGAEVVTDTGKTTTKNGRHVLIRRTDDRLSDNDGS